MSSTLYMVAERWPDLIGGFSAYCVHQLHHEVFHHIWRLVPHKPKGGAV